MLRVTVFKTDFQSFLYWRERGYPPAGAVDVFGSAILRSVEGHILLGRQMAGHINGGMVYLPGGFIDARDVAADGSIDVASSIAREVAEETYLDVATLRPGSRFVVARCGPHLSLGRELWSGLTADALRAHILARRASDPDPELADVVVIRAVGDLAAHQVPDYTRMVVEALLAERVA